MSPADELEATQLTMDEIAAAVHEAEAASKYVMAHVYTPRAIANCLTAGVRTIEHGNFLDEEQAAEMKKRGAYLVPTITTYDLIDRFGAQYGIPEFNLEKIRLAKTGSFESVRIAMAAGVKIGSGSDLLAQMQPYKTMELPLKAQVMTPMEAIVSATRTSARSSASKTAPAPSNQELGRCHSRAPNPSTTSTASSTEQRQARPQARRHLKNTFP
jgi:imidazolonepropionase-like amidohydrolase